jgi:lipopolysaccharide biosynthesis glycosyltransferase
MYIYIYILGNGISKKSIERLKIISNRYDNVHLIFLEVKTSGLLSKTNSNLDLSTYNRLFLGYYIKDNIEKIIYIDADTLILESLKEFWDIDTDNYVVAGVQDLAYSQSNPLGLPGHEKYLNAGVLLINFKEWKKLEENFINFIKRTKDINSINHDQGVINHVVNDSKKLLIKPHYNSLGTNLNTKNFKKLLTFVNTEVYNIYGENIVFDAYKNPIIVHDKIWFKNYPFKDIVKKYEEYVKISPFEYDEVFNNNPLHNFNDFIIYKSPNFLYPLLRKVVVFKAIMRKIFNKLR